MHAFHAMGTEVTVGAPELSLTEEAVLAERVAALFEEREQCFSRFRTDSELSSLLASDGPTVVSPELFDALWSAQRHHANTGGLFEPAVGAMLVALGYDRSFDQGRPDRAVAGPVPPRASVRELVLEPRSRTVVRPAHLRIDLGGLVKGRTVDEAVQLLPSIGVVEAGGDAFLRGAGPEGRGWCVEVEDPRDPTRVLATLRVTDRAVATSAANRRRWSVGGAIVHHLVDPRTGAPSRSDLAQVTVVAASAELADVLAKTFFLLGRVAAREALVAFPEVGALLVGNDGAVARAGAIEIDDGWDATTWEVNHA